MELVLVCCVTKHRSFAIGLGDGLSLHAGDGIQDKADDHPAHKHDACGLAHVHGVVGHEEQDEDHGGDQGREATHRHAAGDLIGTLHIGCDLPQTDQREGGDAPGQHEGRRREGGDGADQAGAQEGADQGQQQADQQAGNGNAVLILLGKDAGHQVATAHGHEQAGGSHEEAVPSGEQAGDSAQGDEPVQHTAHSPRIQGLEHGSSGGLDM